MDIEDGNIEQHLEKLSVGPRDIIYRMDNWGRNKEVHIERSIQIIYYEGRNKGRKIENFNKLETPYFTVKK